jgi:hypothetical protein
MQPDVKEQSGANPGASSATDPPRADGNGHARHYEPPSEAVARLGRLIGEYKEYLAYYVGAKADSFKASIRNAGIYAGLGIIGLIAGGAIIVTSCVLLIAGIAAGLGQLFTYLIGPAWAWLGDLIVGVVVLGAIGIGAWLMLSKLTKSFRSSTVKKYEQRQNWQRGQFGRSVKDAADQAERS